MHQLISKKIIFYILLFFLFGTVNNLNIYKFKIPNVDKVVIDGFDENEKLKILANLMKYLFLDMAIFLEYNCCHH